MHPYRDTPYYVHGHSWSPYDSKPGPFGGNWRTVPGVAGQFYNHIGPHQFVPKPFVPKARYHSKPAMHRRIQKKHKMAWNKLQQSRSSMSGNYAMQKRMQESKLLGILPERHFPANLMPFIKAEAKKMAQANETEFKTFQENERMEKEREALYDPEEERERKRIRASDTS